MKMDKKELTSSLLKKCETVCAYFSMQDYLRANTDKHGKRYKKHHPYSLSCDAEEALEYVHKCHNAYIEGLTKETEEELKAYLMKVRILHSDIF